MKEDFHSPLARELRDFVKHKRALGYSYQRAAATLRSFDRYIQAHADVDDTLSLPDLLRGWLSSSSNRKPVSVTSELGTVRQFFRYRRRFAPNGFVPGREWASQAVRADFIPYIFSMQQIRALLDEAARLRCDRRVRPAIRMLILILYCTGLRFGEAIRLEMRDVDMTNHVFSIRQSKGKTRLVPFRSDLAKELCKYRQSRDQLASPEPHASFLVRPDGKAFVIKGASGIVRGMLRRLGYKQSRGRIGPRPYDIRHTFAVHRLLAWHRGGIDVHSRLPWLSAYLGHDDIYGTEVYLHATSELMELASHRLQAMLHGRRTP